MHVHQILERYNIAPRKSWGQNFLVHEKVAERIVSACNLQKDDMVLEIGPGLGILTGYLTQSSALVMAVERDRRLCQYLSDDFSAHKNLDIICEDILKFEIGPYLEKRLKSLKRIQPGQKTRQNNKAAEQLCDIFRDKKVKVIGNLPYYITTAIINYLIDRRDYIESVFVTVQREVAQRLCAGPGSKDYGSISCRVQFYAHLNKLFTIKPSAFYPQPEVASSLLRMDFLKKPAYKVRDEEFLFKIIRAGFSQRRKTILNALHSSLLIKKMGRDQLEKKLIEVDINPSARAETISLSDFVRLSDKIDMVNIGQEFC